MGRLSF
ncbi:istB-like ATP binding family protein, partial [Chlamydia psittaci 08-2626_L3]